MADSSAVEKVSLLALAHDIHKLSIQETNVAAYTDLCRLLSQSASILRDTATPFPYTSHLTHVLGGTPEIPISRSYVLVLLGDVYYAGMEAQAAADVLSRRAERIAGEVEQIKCALREKKSKMALLQSLMEDQNQNGTNMRTLPDVNEEGERMVEIREPVMDVEEDIMPKRKPTAKKSVRFATEQESEEVPSSDEVKTNARLNNADWESVMNVLNMMTDLVDPQTGDLFAKDEEDEDEVVLDLIDLKVADEVADDSEAEMESNVEHQSTPDDHEVEFYVQEEEDEDYISEGEDGDEMEEDESDSTFPTVMSVPRTLMEESWLKHMQNPNIDDESIKENTPQSVIMTEDVIESVMQEAMDVSGDLDATRVNAEYIKRSQAFYARHDLNGFKPTAEVLSRLAELRNMTHDPTDYSSIVADEELPNKMKDLQVAEVERDIIAPIDLTQQKLDEPEEYENVEKPKISRFMRSRHR